MTSVVDPPLDCALCPRLSGFIATWRQKEPGWHNGPVPTWLPPEGEGAVRLLIVGLAPGLRGANRTGRPFTGDASGETLFGALDRHGLALGHRPGTAGAGVELVATAITNAVRCVPPENRPIAAEINNCRAYLEPTLARFENLQTVLALGKIAHEACIRALGGTVSAHRFAHGAQTALNGVTVVSSYHCSRYNMNTGRLTEAMFDAVMADIVETVER
ncbi:MAG: uracil-DNA glycosylase [Roseitalea sp.]|jgi:uracil-DNA glycosylase family 4|nr:uracil-DNA glycosylase [Roseitalea sp.]MBO6723761.1 uracil-DNA glycosylase [Roseitalea sp.]MBO6744140.1 uracil-DNA glycosylase [Roseitalea sp.]